jgi:hypothetical protein
MHGGQLQEAYNTMQQQSGHIHHLENRLREEMELRDMRDDTWYASTRGVLQDLQNEFSGSKPFWRALCHRAKSLYIREKCWPYNTRYNAP